MRPARTCCLVLPTESDAGVSVAVPVHHGGCLVLGYRSTSKERDTNLSRCGILVVVLLLQRAPTPAGFFTVGAASGLLGPAAACTLLGTVFARLNEVHPLETYLLEFCALEGGASIGVHVCFEENPSHSPPRSPACIPKTGACRGLTTHKFWRTRWPQKQRRWSGSGRLRFEDLQSTKPFSFVRLTSVPPRPFHHTDLHRMHRTDTSQGVGHGAAMWREVGKGDRRWNVL